MDHRAPVRGTASRTVGQPDPDLDEAVDRLLGQWREAGLSRSAIVAAVGPSSAGVLCAAWAAAEAGLGFLHVDPTLSVDETAYVLNVCEVGAVVTVDGYADGEDLEALTPRVQQRASVASFGCLMGPVGPVAKERTLARLVVMSQGTEQRPHRGPDIAVQLIGAGGRWAELVPASSSEVLRLCSGTASPLALGWALRVLAAGGRVVVGGSDDLDSAVTSLHVSADGALDLIRDGFAERMAASPRAVLVSGGACPEPTARLLGAVFGAGVRHVYGAAERLVVSWLDGAGREARTTSVGIPPPGTVRVVSATGAETATGEVGVVHVVDDAAPGGWTSLGDLGRLGEDGHLHIVGRAGDSLLADNEVLHLRQLEELVLRHPGVRRAAAFGLPVGAVAREALVLVEQDAGQRVDRTTLGRHLARRGWPVQVPVTFDIVDRLPVTSSGTVVRRTLTARVRLAQRAS